MCHFDFVTECIIFPQEKNILFPQEKTEPLQTWNSGGLEQSDHRHPYYLPCRKQERENEDTSSKVSVQMLVSEV